MTAHWEAEADLVVVGSGVAGLTAALDAAELGLRVVVVTKDAADAGSTRYAQGGVAVVLGDVPGDSVEAHVADTLVAGAGLSDLTAVTEILTDGPAAVARLRARGATFDPGADGRLARTREGGHSAFRVVHAGGDATGAEVERALVAAATDRRLPLLAGHVAVDALRDERGTVSGLAVLDDAGRPGMLRAPAVLLASGGYGQLYASTTNPATATGDGLALALRAGATVADLEFVQFHPTVLYTGPAVGRRPLVTEAVRGEGAVLLDRAGRRFMTDLHPLADLAPRDVVAAAITRTLAATGADCVHLDATAIPDFARRFPTVHAACRAAGIDPVREPIPVTPAAHYACGGVVTDLHGRTSVPGLYAAGEVARTGLHGANRLASNSLLEGLVVGARAARAVAADRAAVRPAPGECLVASPAAPLAPRAVVQQAMTAAAGIGRDAAGLAAASDRIEEATAVGVPADRAGVEDAALTVLAQAVLAAAGTRTESRGCHVRTDFPDRDDQWQRASLVLTLDADGRPVVQAGTAVAA
ncbi:L-aspartate oxidase [Pseudonocardia sp. DSM 110487]|uniref:L-aspartate oxidase n=1 Tax=Pseudonocardia sp. DSM 110487 TaxID=2865833 RepID=UPI001C6A49D3|nr:L-aspartate oxidase [Pseudonocardia sp. DSM 110487]QYN32792.1 L-aspartate oxidase [Pseudonocardia sp. DSM 110487]